MKIEMKNMLRRIFFVSLVITIALPVSLGNCCTSLNIGSQPVVVILIEFSDYKHSVSKECIYDLVFVKMNAYYTEVSYNQTWIVGEMTRDWIMLPKFFTSYGDLTWTGTYQRDFWDRARRLGEDAIHAADEEIDFRKFKHVIIVLPNVNVICVAVGLNIMTNDGAIVSRATIQTEKSPPGVFAHEFGHNLGLHDMYDYKLAQERGSSSDAIVYVGIWDIMSAAHLTVHFCSYNKIKAGWIPSERIKTVDTNWITVTIDPIELPSKGIQAVRIPLTGVKYYLVEVRKAVGFDNKIPDEGILVTLIDESLGDGFAHVQDAEPKTSTLSDATFDLRPGKQACFLDRKNNVSIVLTGKLNSSYIVFVGPVKHGEVVSKNPAKSLDVIKIMDEAEADIRKAIDEKRIEGVDKAKSLLSNASEAFDRCDLDTAMALAQRSKDLARTATYPKDHLESKNLITKLEVLEKHISTFNFKSAEAQDFALKGASTYDSAVKAFAQNNYSMARDLAQVALNFFEKAIAVEEEYQEAEMKQRHVSNYIVTVSFLHFIAVVAIVVEYYLVRLRSKRLSTDLSSKLQPYSITKCIE
ncbi:immune inhibitor A [Candidatus Bathyarchaeota archaeon]|nr:immune inhibitor A [Candidatus Bathyarchaeota archaeon]